MTPWTAAHQTPVSVEFSRQIYWNSLPFPSPGDLPDPGTKPRSSTLQADSYHLSHQGREEAKRWGKFMFNFSCHVTKCAFHFTKPIQILRPSSLLAYCITLGGSFTSRGAIFQNVTLGDFPGGAVFRTLCFHYRRCGFNP